MHGIGLLQGIDSEVVATAVVVDTTGFEGVVFFSEAGATMQLLEGDLANGTDQANVGASHTIGAGKGLQIHKPHKRYVSQTGSATCIAVKYGARKSPATTGNFGSEVSPT